MEKFSGQELRQRRLDHGLSAEELAVAIGYSYVTLNMWERDVSTPRTHVVCRLAEALDCHPGDLFRPCEDDSALRVRAS